ncbi:MAG: M15 family metallopeptidase [Clostridia bacterium]|nr:M15 family metallopeptidase [Clostridia bacterium]
MKSKIRKSLPFLAFFAVFCAVTLAIHLNVDKLFLCFEEWGWFSSEVEINACQEPATVKTSFEALRNDPRVSIDRSLMLVNTEYTLPDGFEPQISEYKDTDVFMSSCMLDAYASLSAAVAEQFDQKLYVSSDLRSAEEQAALYLEDPLTATLPGASEHQTGLALDVYVAYFAGDGFLKSPAGRFVNAECWKYGFIIRYPSFGEDVTGIRFEPWHIRYVGLPHAKIIYNNRLTLEEYVLSMEIGKWYKADGYLYCRQALTADGKLSLPESFESCVISPDNTGCYIVTVKNAAE